MAFDFFRRYQKAILYTAGFFALITFSITGALMNFFDNLFVGSQPSASLVLPDDRTVNVTPEDAEIGSLLARGQHGLVPVLPPFLGDDDRQHASEILAALRRLAIESGIEYSEAEAREAIAQTLKLLATENLTEVQLAQRLNFTSATPFRKLVGEALRISTYLRMAALAIDVTDKALVDDLLANRELITLQVASLDKRKIETELKKTPVTDEQLQEWVAKLPEKEQTLFRHSSNRVGLKAVGLLHEKFDPAQWPDELKDKQYGEEVLNQRYMLDRELRWRKARPEAASQPQSGPTTRDDKGGTGEAEKKDGEPKKGGPHADAQDPASRPATDPAGVGVTPQTQPATQEPAVQGPPAATQPADPYVPFDQVRETIRKILQTEDVVRALWGKVQEKMAAHLKDAIEARNKAAEEVTKAQTAVADAEKALKAGPETDALKKAVDDAKAAQKAKEEAKTAADEAVDARRKEFDAVQAFRDLAKDKDGNERAGLATFHKPEPQLADGLKDLGDLGTWTNTWVATAMDAEGDLGTQVQSTDKASFEFQVGTVVKRPLKDFAEIKTQAEAEYWKKRADEAAKTRIETFEAALVRLAKDARKAEIEKLENEKRKNIDDRLEEWRRATRQKLEDARKTLAGIRDRTSRGHQAWSKVVADLEAQLAKEGEEKERIEKALNAEVDAEIKGEARKAYAQVLAAAAAEAGLEVTAIGPHHRELHNEPRFHDRFPEAVRFLWSQKRIPPPAPDVTDEAVRKTYDEAKFVRDLKADESTELLEDVTNRTLHLAVVTKAEKATIESITRRDLLTRREQFVRERLIKGIQQSFSREALKERNHYVRPGEEEPVAKAEQKVGDAKTGPKADEPKKGGAPAEPRKDDPKGN
jgi:hypothetical protein